MGLIKLQKFFLFLFIIFSLLFSIFTVVRIVYGFQLQDFSVYYQGVQNYLSYRNPYTDLSSGRFIYPPISLVLLTPFGVLPHELAERVWTLISYLSMVGSIFIIFKSVEWRSWRIPFLVVYGLFTMSFPVKFTLGMGQINLILLLFISLSFYYFRKRRSYLSGVALAIAASIKLSPMILLLFFVRKKEWKIVVSFVTVFVLLNFLGVGLVGLSATKSYWMDVFPSIPTVGNASYYNQALTGWLSRASVSNLMAGIINYLVFGGLIFISFIVTQDKRRRAGLELGELGLFIVSILIGGGLSWQHHFVVTLVPFVALWIILQKKMKKSWAWMVLMLLSYLLVSTNIKDPMSFSGIGGRLILSHVFYGALLLYGLLVASLRSRSLKNEKCG